jgi:hypothetical protein
MKMTGDFEYRIEQTLEQQGEDIKEIKIAIVGDVTNNNKIGLKGQVARIKDSVTRVWWVLAIIIGILGYVVGIK